MKNVDAAAYFKDDIGLIFCDQCVFSVDIKTQTVTAPPEAMHQRWPEWHNVWGKVNCALMNPEKGAEGELYLINQQGFFAVVDVATNSMKPGLTDIGELFGVAEDLQLIFPIASGFYFAGLYHIINEQGEAFSINPSEKAVSLEVFNEHDPTRWPFRRPMMRFFCIPIWLPCSALRVGSS